MTSNQAVLLNSTQYFLSIDPAIDLCSIRSNQVSFFLSPSFFFFSFPLCLSRPLCESEPVPGQETCMQEKNSCKEVHAKPCLQRALRFRRAFRGGLAGHQCRASAARF